MRWDGAAERHAALVSHEPASRGGVEGASTTTDLLAQNAKNTAGCPSLSVGSTVGSTVASTWATATQSLSRVLSRIGPARRMAAAAKTIGRSAAMRMVVASSSPCWWSARSAATTGFWSVVGRWQMSTMSLGVCPARAGLVAQRVMI